MGKLKDLKIDVKKLLEEVETDIQAMIKSEGDALRKAAGEEPGADEGGESGGDGGGDAPPADGGGDAPPAGPEASAPGGDAPPAGPEASAPPAGPEASAPAGDPAAETGPVDPEALKAEYLTLGQQNPEELKAHYMACKAALFEVMSGGGAGGSDPTGAAPPAGPGPEASAPPAAAPAPAMKAEVPASMKNNPANGGTERAAVPDAIKKYEDEIAELKQQMDLTVKALDMALGTPVRKAITTTRDVPGTNTTPEVKDLSKSEINARIDKALNSGKLTKSDKGRLMSYALGNLDLNGIKDLLQ